MGLDYYVRIYAIINMHIKNSVGGGGGGVKIQKNIKKINQAFRRFTLRQESLEQSQGPVKKSGPLEIPPWTRCQKDLDFKTFSTHR